MSTTTKSRNIICIDIDILIDSSLKSQVSFATIPIKKEAEFFLKELAKDFLIMLHSNSDLEQVNQWLSYNSIKKHVYIVSNYTPKNGLRADIHLFNYHKNYTNMLKAIRKYGK